MSDSKLKDKAAKGFLWGTLNNGATQLLNALFGFVLARILDPKEYGVIGMLAIFSCISVALQESGFVTALTNKKDATHKDYNSVFWFNIGISLILYILLFLSAPLIADFYHTPVLLDLSRYYFLAFFIASFSIVPRALLFRQLKQKQLAIMGLISLILSGTVGIIMALNGAAYWGLATQTITFNLSVSVCSWILSRWKPSFSITFQPVREMFSFSVKMLITNIVNHVNNNIFSIVLGRQDTVNAANEVGNYAQANKWNNMGASTITGMVQGVAQPTFVQIIDDHERLCRAFRKMLRFTCFVSFPVMFGLSLIAPEFIVITIKDKWLDSAHLMQILCIGGAFQPIATLYFNLIISRGKSNIYMWNMIAQCLTILSTVIAISMLDLQQLPGGINISNLDLMVTAYVCIVILWTGIWHYFLWREIRIPFVHVLKDILPFLVIAAGTMLVTYWITLPITNIYLLFVSRILTAAVIYVGTLYLLGANILKECIGYLRKKKPAED